MLKRLNQLSIVDVTTKRGVYKVVLERLKNTYDGAPRFKAIIIIMEIFGAIGVTGTYNIVYTFKGHYHNDMGEAQWIVEQYEEELA